jgi:hypothetical protein
MTNCGSIALNLPGEPRRTVWYDDGRLWVVLPNGENEYLPEEPCSADQAVAMVYDMYASQPTWKYRGPAEEVTK